jgi:hypothetical protein
MPLCIAGMHRSGTSMAASLLYHCGLDLGPQNDMLSPNANNPEGFWESRSFLRLNDALLKHRGGSWDNPPSQDVLGWENEPSLRPLRIQAERLLRRFDGREPWGWKDPRNCLTLPWWRTLLPAMKVLICVRNPLAVAESLRVRDGISYADSFDLWLTYNRSVLTATSAERRVVTHCDNYLDDPRDELRRVLHECDMTATNEQIERACRQVKPSLVHHRMTRNDLVRAGASEKLLACYAELWDEAAVFCPN